jgi:hypothetical protein
MTRARSRAIVVGLSVFAFAACGSSSARVGPVSPTPSTATLKILTPGTAPNPRGATANVGYVERLVADHKLPHAAAVTAVSAEAGVIVVATTLNDHTSGEELYEALSRAVGCDDRFLLVKGERVVLRDGTGMDSPRPGFVACAGT